MTIQVVVMMVMCLLGYGDSSKFVFNVHHMYGGRDSTSVSKLRAHDIHRHGRMLGAVDFPIGGTTSRTGVGLYYMKLMIGTPPKAYHVHFDTGSDILWLNCAGCDGCPKKTSLGIDLVQYDVKASSTASWVNCEQDICENLRRGICDSRMQCGFDISYAEGSKTVGSFVHDFVHIDQVIGDLKTASVKGTLVFGCSSQASGMLSTADECADGVVGFGQSNSSLISQLTAQGKAKKIFSHCFDRHGGGILALGQVVQPQVISTPLVPNRQHYTLTMMSIEVGGVALHFPNNAFDGCRETIIDSGSTYVYFNDVIYGTILDKLMEKHRGLKAYVFDGFQCFDYRGNVDDAFPNVTLQFKDSLKLMIYPHDYLISFKDGVQCIGLLSTRMHRFTLLGDIILSNRLFVFDLESQTIGWTEHKCSSGIEVEDDSTGYAYTVGAHDTPPSSDSIFSRSETRNIFILFFIIILHFCM